MNGGVGDHVASLVAINYIDKKYPWVKQLVWTPDFLVSFAKHLLPKTVTVAGYVDMVKDYDKNLTTKTTAWGGVTSPMKIHCLDYAFLKLCDEIPAIEHKNYLQISPDEIDTDGMTLPKDYVVITTGYTAKVRKFKDIEVNKIVPWCKAKGIEVVFLGQTQTNTGSAHIIKGAFDKNINYTTGVNLIDKTTLLQAAKIMGNAVAVVGVDNGLLHVAGCTQVNIIGGFTTVSPEMRMPVRHNALGWNFHAVRPDANLPCSFCQETTNFLYGHDYKDCIYKDYKCVDQMKAEKFITELEKIV